MEIWKMSSSKANKLVLINSESVYIGSPSFEDLNRLHPETKDLKFLDKIFNIPFRYIKKVSSPIGSNKIEIHYGKKSEDLIIVENVNQQNEIFASLRNSMPRLRYRKRFPTIWQAAKPSIFAILIVSSLFTYTYYLAHEIEQGIEYRGGGALSGMMLAIAKLGISKTIIIFTPLLGIALFTFFRKIKARKETEFLL